MPTYAYACTQCGHRFDAVQSFAEPSLTECPQCGGRLRKEYGSIGVTFNGSGFYRTDSRAAAEKNGDKPADKASESAKPAAEKSGGDASSSSPSSTSETKSSPAPAGT